ncbi:MAG: hypothetical protein M1131_07575 [Actinobacteria bacterium]|nr:hypothetical protein [Actinomycetota bacterium]MCL6094597.1 hypothetical protein [Actinomycetota bacterium]
MAGVTSSGIANLNRTSPIDELRSRALNAGRAFLGVNTVAARSRVMTLNAQLAASKLGTRGAAFNVVAQALDEVVGRLTELVGAVERGRATVIGGVARFTQMENQLKLYGRALGRVSEQGSAVGVSLEDALDPTSGNRWKEALGKSSDRSIEAFLWGALLSLREEMLNTLGDIRSATKSLVHLIEQVEVLAASHGFFIGINGVIEAAYVRQEELVQLAKDLRSLTDEINQAVASASQETKMLKRLADAAGGVLHIESSTSYVGRTERAVDGINQLSETGRISR